jgi:hypothetical protein
MWIAKTFMREPANLVRCKILSSLQKGDLFTTETTEIIETKDKFIFSQK